MDLYHLKFSKMNGHNEFSFFDLKKNIYIISFKSFPMRLNLSSYLFILIDSRKLLPEYREFLPECGIILFDYFF